MSAFFYPSLPTSGNVRVRLTRDLNLARLEEEAHTTLKQSFELLDEVIRFLQESGPLVNEECPEANLFADGGWLTVGTTAFHPGTRSDPVAWTRVRKLLHLRGRLRKKLRLLRDLVEWGLYRDMPSADWTVTGDQRAQVTLNERVYSFQAECLHRGGYVWQMYWEDGDPRIFRAVIRG